MEANNGKKFRWTMIVVAAICILLGVYLICMPEEAGQNFTFAIGIGLLAVGLFNIVYYFLKKISLDGMQFELASGLVFALLGVVLLLNRERIMEWTVGLIGFLIMVGSFILLQIAMNIRRIGGAYYKYMLSSALFMFVVGGLFLFAPFQAGKVLNIFAGIALVVNGAITLWMSIQLAIVTKKAMKQGTVLNRPEVPIEPSKPIQPVMPEKPAEAVPVEPQPEESGE